MRRKTLNNKLIEKLRQKMKEITLREKITNFNLQQDKPLIDQGFQMPVKEYKVGDYVPTYLRAKRHQMEDRYCMLTGKERHMLEKDAGITQSKLLKHFQIPKNLIKMKRLSYRART